MSSKRIGAQEPTVRVEPSRAYTDGDDAAQLVSAYGMTPDEWQKTVLDAWLGRDANDKFTATTCGLSVPRQNGKNAIIEMYELYHLVAIGSSILHTAHEVKTARKSFLRLAGFFQNTDYPELMDMLVSVRQTNGQEGIVLKNGGSIEFIARTKGAARGFTVDSVVFDEASFLTNEQLEAIMSTMAAAPLGNRQLVYTGTPPIPSWPCEVFAKVRDDAHKKRDPRLSWHEWSVSEIPPAHDFSDVADACYATNPALGIRLDEGFTQTEFHRLSVDGFARERLGWWLNGGRTNTLIREADWDRLAVCKNKVPTDAQPNKKAFGVKFTPDGTKVAICVAIKQPDGTVHTELTNNGYRLCLNGTRWICDFLMERKDTTAAVAIDGLSGANVLIKQLYDAGYPKRAVQVPGTQGVITASSMLLDAVQEGSLTHFGQEQLNVSATTSTKRKIGNSGGWGFDGDEAAPIEAASLALWAAKTTKRNPGRKAVVL